MDSGTKSIVDIRIIHKDSILVLTGKTKDAYLKKQKHEKRTRKTRRFVNQTELERKKSKRVKKEKTREE
jgi:hypothetical protein